MNKFSLPHCTRVQNINYLGHFIKSQFVKLGKELLQVSQKGFGKGCASPQMRTAHNSSKRSPSYCVQDKNLIHCMATVGILHIIKG